MRANLGVLQYFAGRYSEAIENLRAALAQKSDLVKLRALLGMAEKRTGQNAPAIADLEQSFPRLAEQKRSSRPPPIGKTRPSSPK